jgi:SAM-dependent methyltransferase
MSDGPGSSSLDDLFDAHYLRFYRSWHENETEGEVDLIAHIFGPALDDATLLDLGCGEGRIAAELAAAGVQVTGIDASAAMLAAAELRRAALAAPDRLRLVHGDFRSGAGRTPPIAPGSFDTALSWFTSFGYGPDDAADRATLEGFATFLKPGGVLVLETVNRDQHAQPDPTFEVLRDGDDLLVDERRFDPVTGRLHVERRLAVGAERYVRRFGLRLFTAPELLDWLDRAGFANAELFGDEFRDFELTDGRMIVRAEAKPRR